MRDLQTVPPVQESDLNWDDSCVVFEKEYVLKGQQKLNGAESPGPDGLHPILLKECAASIAEPLSLIFSRSFESGLLPAD